MSQSTVTCLCGQIKVPLKTPVPASTELCHCNICRHTTGAFFVGLPALGYRPDASILDKCPVYKTSDRVDRYFCSSCGTKLFVNTHHKSDGTPIDDTESWYAFGGAIDPPEGSTTDVLSIERHHGVSDTTDGGLAPFLSTPTAPAFGMKTDPLSHSDLAQMIKTSTSQSPPGEYDKLKVSCHCGGVSLLILRADHTERSISQLDRFIPRSPTGSVEEHKHFASTCVCRSCRLHTGSSFVPWIYVPGPQILNAHTGKPVVVHRAAYPDRGQTAAESANKGLTLKFFWSSDDSTRSFCYVCGAAVFYSMDRRQEITNIAAGLLRADDGVMARGWLSWQWGRCSWKDEATDKSILEAWKATADPESVKHYLDL